MISEVLDQLVGLCQAHGINSVFQCPGSRNAPLTLAFERQKSIAQHTVFDERVAGYMALGHSLAAQKAAIVHTTSGTAAYNLAPAVAEAFFAQVPLIVFTADRPSEWLGHQDGQMIQQQNIFGTHVKAFFQMPVSATHQDDIWAFQQIVNEAIMTAHSFPAGPVHLNFPFREPFYPKEDYNIDLENLNFSFIEEVKTLPLLDKYVLHSFVEQWQNTENRLIVVGQMPYDLEIRNALTALHYYTGVPILADVTSNLHGIEGVITEHDLFLKGIHSISESESLKPELLLTLGGPILSKHLKNFLRKNPAKGHWHLQIAGKVANPLQSITKIIRCQPAHFITKLGEASFFSQKDETKSPWQTQALVQTEKLVNYEPTWGDYNAMQVILKNLPEDAVLHLGNSMSVRYANFLSNCISKHTNVYCNRGTSGIDGSTSTAIGVALAMPEKQHFLISGDVSFQYDSNALWSNSLPKNLFIVIINNEGGNIFRLIDGPGRFEAMKERFETNQTFTAQGIADEAAIPYFSAFETQELTEIVKQQFSRFQQTAILEVFTDPLENEKNYQQLNAL